MDYTSSSIPPSKKQRNIRFLESLILFLSWQFQRRSLESYLPGKELLKIVLEADGKNSQGPLHHPIIIGGLEIPNKMFISSSARQQSASKPTLDLL